MIALSYFIGVYSEEVTLPWRLVPPTLTATASIYVILKCIRILQDRIGVTWWSVPLAVLGIWVPLQGSRVIFGLQPGSQDRLFLNLAPTFVRGMIAIFIFLTTIGYVVNRLQREKTLAIEALDVAREQQVQIIAADEAAKRQAALLLHDRVQAGLIASCLELQGFSRGLEAEQQIALDPIINRLERMRSIDVGSATRILSPNLVDLDLTTALEELAAQYAQVVDVVIDVDEHVDAEYTAIGENVLLGAYRIIEQALLNSVKHAEPKHVWISVTLNIDGLQVQVSDDGHGLPAEITSGIGTTIITTWVRALEGQWRWERRPVARGTTLLAVLPCQS